MSKKIFLWGLICAVGLSLFCGCNSVNDPSHKNNNQNNISDEVITGAFYTLSEAYNSGYLSKEDLQSIADYLNEEIEFPESLDSEVEKAIKETAAYNIRNRDIEPFPDATAGGIIIVAFYGVYSDNFVIKMRNNYDLHPDDVPSRWEEIGGIQFHFIGYDRVSVWREKE